MSDHMISDIPMFKEALQQMRAMKVMGCLFPLVKPILKLLNVDVESMDEAFSKLDDLIAEAEELSKLPDRFNDAFVDRAWIAYDHLNIDAAKQAVELADNGDIDAGEQVVLDYYSPETVRLQIMFMKRIEAFKPRLRLALLAQKDYAEKRYHACVPVVLALMDGLTSDLNNGKGIFAKGTDLTAWNSIAAHAKGLVELGNVMRKGRYQIRTEEITIPYRHGIMHGFDLGYANRTVAAKTWAALFAVGDWALKAEKGELVAPPPAPKRTAKELFEMLLADRRMQDALNEWQPRELVIGDDVPETGQPEDYEDGSPEQKLVEFLTLWVKKNYGHMAKCVSSKKGTTPKEMAGEVRRIFGDAVLSGFRIAKIADSAAAVSNITVSIKYQRNEQTLEKGYEFRLLYMDENGRSEVRGAPGCRWCIENWRYFYQGDN